MSEADAQKLQAIHYWFGMAHECLASARREANADALPFAMNRLYYAVFYAVSAVLLERGVSFEKHTAVRAALHRDLIKPGVIDKRWGRLYDRLFEDRQQGDYLPFTTFDASFIEEQIEEAEAFVALLQGLTNATPTSVSADE